MHLDGHLGLQLVRQGREDLLFVEGLLVGPEVVEPLDDALLQLLGHLAELHVLLDAVHLLLELGPRRVHVGDHAAHVAHDGGEDEHADEEVDDDEEVLHVLLRLRRLPDGGQRQRGPVETVDVLAGQRLVLGQRDVGVDPQVRPEPDGAADGEVDAGVPVDDDEDVQNQRHDSPQPRETRPRLCSVGEVHEPTHAEQSVEADVRSVQAYHEV